MNEQSNIFLREVNRVLGIMKEYFDSKLQLIGERYGTMKEMVGAIAEYVQIVKSNIVFIKGSLHWKVDYDEFSAIEKESLYWSQRLKNSRQSEKT